MIGFAATVVLLAPANEFLADALELDQKLRATEVAVEEARSERERLRIETSRLEGELAAARLRHREVYEQYERRVRALAKMPKGARLLMLGSSESLRDYLRTSRLLRRVARADRTVALQRARAAERVERLEAEARAREADAAALEQRLRSERDRLAELRAQKLALLEQLARDATVAARVRREAANARRELGALVDKLEPRGALRARFADNRGRLPWPTSGELGARYGQDVEREFGTRVKHNGLDFIAPTGTPVQTVAPGSVAYADWLRGYGQLVIVDHGGGYHSLYAHLQAVTVTSGDAVELGDVVGSVGDSGSLRGTVLYFELRKDGAAIDPASWLRPE